MWVEDDVMYMGYYSAGARVVDVSGELRGDLYRQGREIARLWTGDPKGFRPNSPFTWGAQPHKGLIYFNDINSGVWITRLAAPADHRRRQRQRRAEEYELRATSYEYELRGCCALHASTRLCDRSYSYS